MKTNRLHRYLPILLLLTAALVTGCPHSTGPTEVGVRTVKLSFLGNSGVQERIYEPGSTHFFLPWLNDWHTFDVSQQKLEMTDDMHAGDRLGRDAVVFKTIDGNDIALNLIITYRIEREKAPMILQEVASGDTELKNIVVRALGRSKPRDIFGELNTEDFYEAEKRAQKAEQVKNLMNEMLAGYGVIVERVGTGTYRFNPAYQKAIEDKKVAEQQAEKFASSTNAAKEEYVRKVEQARGEIGKVKAAADGEYNRAVIEADAYYEQQELLAQAIEAEGRATAEGIRKMNEALAGSGGEAMVKLRIAEALKGKNIVMIPMGDGGLDLRSTDINSLLQVYGLKQVAGE